MVDSSTENDSTRTSSMKLDQSKHRQVIKMRQIVRREGLGERGTAGYHGEALSR